MRKKKRSFPYEQLQKRELLAADFYTFDGTENNIENTEWGSTYESLIRLAEADYADGISETAGADRPSAREISNEISSQVEDVINENNLSAFIYTWGQFIDHDIGLTPTGGTELLTIEVPEGDLYFDPDSTGTAAIYTTRSIYDTETGTDVDNPREQINTITSWIDASMVYGSSQEVADALRTFEGGQLKMSEDGLLPLNNDDNFPEGTLSLDNDAHRVSDDELFAAGDVRVNENIELTSLQTLFAREHNRLALEYAADDPSLSDEELYQMARATVIAEIQSITFNEFLPALLGQNAVDDYEGYDASVNPSLSNEFSAAAFRLGHSLLGDDVEFLDENGNEIAEEIPLSEAFFNPTILNDVSIESIFKYLASDPSSELDPLVVDSLRNFLFGEPGEGGLDLVSLNIERGRDHGLADYNTTREAIGLERVTDFSDITSDVAVQEKLAMLYGSVDDIDLWVGLLVEDHAADSSAGETLTAIVADQFERLRDGDRFWYQNTLSGDALAEIESTTLSDIISRNTDLQNLQDNVFVFEAEITGALVEDTNGHSKSRTNNTDYSGWTVELVSASSGEVIATSATDRYGKYSFDVQDGVRTGEYFVQATLDAAGNAVAYTSATDAVTVGGDELLLNIAVGTGDDAGHSHQARNRKDGGRHETRNQHSSNDQRSRNHQSSNVDQASNVDQRSGVNQRSAVNQRSSNGQRSNNDNQLASNLNPFDQAFAEFGRRRR